MPDLTMCSNSDCKKYGKCYRAQAKPWAWQSYATFDMKTHKCFIKLESSVKIKRAKK